MNTRKFLLIIPWLFFFIPQTLISETPHFPENFAPGWASGAVEEYISANDLFIYMNGGAELYLEYRFSGLSVREYTSEQGNSLSIEIYQFVTPEDAYGIFSIDTSGIAVDIGQGSRKTSLSTRFWKGRFFVRTFVWQSNSETEGIPDTAAYAVALNIKEEGKLPPWLQKLISGQSKVSFLRGEIALRQIAGSLQFEILPIDRRNGAAWVIPEKPDYPGALVLNYLTVDKTTRTFDQIWTKMTRDAEKYAQVGQRGIAVQKNGSIAGLEILKTNIIWIPSAKDEASCAETLDLISAALNEKEEITNE